MSEFRQCMQHTWWFRCRKEFSIFSYCPAITIIPEVVLNSNNYQKNSMMFFNCSSCVLKNINPSFEIYHWFIFDWYSWRFIKEKKLFTDSLSDKVSSRSASKSFWFRLQRLFSYCFQRFHCNKIIKIRIIIFKLLPILKYFRSLKNYRN